MLKTISVLLLSLSVAACDSTSTPAADMGPAQDGATTATGKVLSLRLTSQVSGWTEQSGSYVTFTAASFFGLINGGAQPHMDRGLVEGIYQVLTHTAGRQADLYAEDFGTAANAQSMYTYEKGLISTPLTLTKYGAAVATGYESLGGAVFHAVFGSFYFKLNLTGYTSAEQATLLSDVEAFLAVYETLSSSAAAGG